MHHEWIKGGFSQAVYLMITAKSSENSHEIVGAKYTFDFNK